MMQISSNSAEWNFEEMKMLENCEALTAFKVRRIIDLKTPPGNIWSSEDRFK